MESEETKTKSDQRNGNGGHYFRFQQIDVYM